MTDPATASAADDREAPERGAPIDELLDRLIPSRVIPRDDAFLDRVGAARLKQSLLGVHEDVALNGRYELLETVGSGGMGVVYRAYDRKLDREVALKRPHSRADERSRSDTPPPEFEGLSLARLRHPNVVPVYEVGFADGQLYITMELIPDGETLDAWVARARPGWRAILEAFTDAGRGLAAAHAAGLLHRDFKPSNCVRDPAGRVRVIDFGLALAFRETQWDAGVTENDGRIEDETLTQGPAIAGTPRYMAPEQRAGRPLSPASDQFAFCVALYEALFDSHPADSPRIGASASASASQFHAARRAGVPLWLARVVLRGLAPAPERRYPSMSALLTDLARERSPRWALLSAVVSVSTIAALATTYVATRTRDDDRERCADDSSALHEHLQRRAPALARGLSLIDPGSAEALQRNLNAFAARWRDRVVQACDATHRAGLQSPRALTRRLQCLELRRLELEVLLERVSTGTTRDALNASRALSRLPPLARCDDPLAAAEAGDALQTPGLAALSADHALLGRAPTPAEVEAFVARCDELRGRVAGSPQQALAIHALLLRARARLDLAVSSPRSRDAAETIEATLIAVETTAESIGDDALALAALLSRARLELELRGDHKASRPLLYRATAKLLRLGDPSAAHAMLEVRLAQAANLAGAPEEAATHARAALTRLAHAPATAATPRALLARGEAQRELARALAPGDRVGAALARYESRDALARLLGPRHPDVVALERAPLP